MRVGLKGACPHCCCPQESEDDYGILIFTDEVDKIGKKVDELKIQGKKTNMTTEVSKSVSLKREVYTANLQNCLGENGCLLEESRPRICRYYPLRMGFFVSPENVSPVLFHGICIQMREVFKNQQFIQDVIGEIKSDFAFINKELLFEEDFLAWCEAITNNRRPGYSLEEKYDENTLGVGKIHRLSVDILTSVYQLIYEEKVRRGLIPA